MGLAPYGRPVYKEALEKVFLTIINLTIADIDVTNKRLYSLKLEKELGFTLEKILVNVMNKICVWRLLCSFSRRICYQND